MNKRKHMKRTLLSLLAVLLTATLFFACSGGSASNAKWEKLKSEFKDNGKNEPYSQQVPLDQMDFSTYDQYLPDAVAAIKNDLQRSVELPADVNYYASPDDGAKPVLTLKKGTTVFITCEDGMPYNTMYGLTCFPDYKKGWRYGNPFVKDDFTYEDALAMSERYYVKTSELEQVAAAYYKANEKAFQQEQTSEQYVTGVIQTKDLFLYTGGVFCSPEFAGFFGTDY